MRTLTALCLLLLCGCCSRKEAAEIVQASPVVDSPVAATGPPAIVYRTSVDVGDAVPITLSPDRSEVVSYPHPSDLKRGGEYPLPTPLGEGYLLDNRGIGPNTVFLKWSYAEYAALPKPPSLEELMAAIKHRDPFVEMYDCGVRSEYLDPVKELGELTRAGSWANKCKRLK